MNILFIKKLFSPVGGSEALTYQLATRLASRGHRVRVLCHWPRNHRYGFPPPSELLSGNSVYRSFLHRQVEVVQIRPRFGQLGQVLDVLAPFNLLRREVANAHADGFDLIHNVCREYAAQTLAIARERGIPYITTPLAHPGQAWGGDDEYDLRVYREADAVVALTRAERSWYTNRGVHPNRTYVIGLGPTFEAPGDGASFRHRYRLDGPVVLFVGRKEPYKGIHSMVKSAPLVWTRHPDAKFVFVGEHTFFRRLNDPFGGRADPRFLDLTTLPEGEKPDAFAACDVFCLPSRHETFGLVFAEAWLCGKPVVGSNIPTLRDVITNGVDGLVIPPKPRHIATALNQLLDDPALAKRMGAAGQRKVATLYNWERTVTEHERLYAAVLTRKGGLSARVG